MSTTSSRSEIVLALAEEFLDRYRRGERPALKEYIDRRPELAADIREAFPAMAMMENIALAEGSLADDTASREQERPDGLKELGDYRIIREVGRGGMGVVYEAEQVSLGRHVALKVLPRKTLVDPSQRRRFEREAKAAAKLHHTNIVPVFGVGEHDGLPYYVMQFIQGLGLNEVLAEVKRLRAGDAAPPADRPAQPDVSALAIARSLVTGTFEPADDSDESEAVNCSRPLEGRAAGPLEPRPGSQTPATEDTLRSPSSGSSISLPGQTDGHGRTRSGRRPTYWQSVAQIGVQVAEALDYAHRQGVLHRDIKPSNLLLDLRGTVWVTDFGLAKTDEPDNLTHTGDLLGTLRYMPPEAFAGKADARADVYALGLTLYELLALRPAFPERDKNQLMKQVIEDEPPRLGKLNPAIPRDLRTVVHKASEKDPAHRYATAGELADELRRFAADEPIRARPVGPLERLVKWAKRRPAAAGLVAVSALSVLALLGGGWWHNVHLRRANQTAADRLYHALVGEARALRQARGTGYRVKALDLLQQALRLDTAEQDVWRLRQEAVACLGDIVGLEPTVWTGFEADIRAMALEPLGTQLALGLDDGTILVCDVTSGAHVARLRVHQSPVDALTFGQDGQRLVTADTGGTIKVWEPEARTGWACTWTVTLGAAVSAVAITPDGQLLAACSRDRPNVAVWDLKSRSRVDSFRGHGDECLTCLAFHPDGNLLAAGYHHQEESFGAFVWDVATRRLKPAVITSVGRVRQVLFTTDGRYLVCAGDVGVTLFDTADYRSRQFIKAAGGCRVAVSPEGKLAAITNIQRGGICLWNYAINQEVAWLSHPDAPFLGEFGIGGKVLVTGNARSVRVWDLAGTAETVALPSHDGGVPSVAFSPDGRLLASASLDRTVKVWDPVTGKFIKDLGDFGERLQTVAFSPDGQLLAAGGYDAGTIRIWETGSWHESELPTPAPRLGRIIWTVAFSPDGRYFAAGGGRNPEGGGVIVWRINRGENHGSVRLEQLDQLSGTSTFCSSLCISPDGGLLAWVGVDLTRATRGMRGLMADWTPFSSVRLWDLRNSRELPPLPAQLGFGVRCLAFRPDGRNLALIGSKGVPEVWDVVNGQQAFVCEDREFEGTSSGRVACTGLSADGTWLAQGGSAVRVWDLDARTPLLVLPKERSWPWSFAWSPNKELLAVGSSDGTLVIWNIHKVRAQLAEVGLDW